jgi:hypothetical protein
MPFVSGFLRLRRRGHPDQGLPDGEGPVDPDYGIGEEHPDQGLPPMGGLHPDQGLPRPPPGVWPPLTPTHPIAPTPPGVPPGTIWPPVFPVDPGYGVGIERPDQGLPPTPGQPPRPDQGLPPTPGQPPRPDQGLPGSQPHPDQGLPKPQTYWVVAGIPGVGWRYIAVDPTLRPSHPIARPPTAQPK